MLRPMLDQMQGQMQRSAVGTGYQANAQIPLIPGVMPAAPPAAPVHTPSATLPVPTPPTATAATSTPPSTVPVASSSTPPPASAPRPTPATHTASDPTEQQPQQETGLTEQRNNQQHHPILSSAPASVRHAVGPSRYCLHLSPPVSAPNLHPTMPSPHTIPTYVYHIPN